MPMMFVLLTFFKTDRIIAHLHVYTLKKKQSSLEYSPSFLLSGSFDRQAYLNKKIVSEICKQAAFRGKMSREYMVRMRSSHATLGWEPETSAVM